MSIYRTALTTGPPDSFHCAFVLSRSEMELIRALSQLVEFASTSVGTLPALVPIAVFGSCDALSFTAQAPHGGLKIPPPFGPPMPYLQQPIGSTLRTAAQTSPLSLGR